MSPPVPPAPLFGIMAEFESPNDLVIAARRAHDEGYRKMDAYTPYPIEALDAALGIPHTKLPYVVLGGGIVGCCVGFGLQVYASVFDYPLNVGGKPFYSWPAFIPPTFETTILFAAIAAVLGMLAMNGLPMPHHPVFNVPRFAMASRDRFFLCIESTDPLFEPEKTSRFLATLGPRVVTDVES
jgi:hypothetical protein